MFAVGEVGSLVTLGCGVGWWALVVEVFCVGFLLPASI